MSIISNLFKPLKEQLKYRIRWRYLWGDWFLGRHACLGYDVLKHYKDLPREVNFQKGRADLLAKYWRDPKLLPMTAVLQAHMARKDVLPLIRQLEFFECLPARAPKFIFIDSFAELTDQLFTHKLGKWEFCCAYHDLNQSKLLPEEYECLGLLPLEDIKPAYLSLFDLFEKRWGSVPIYFLHFPVALESRQKYIRRHDAIVKIMGEIAECHPNIHPIEIDASQVFWPSHAPENLKFFPYHYHHSTYLSFFRKVEAIASLETYKN